MHRDPNQDPYHHSYFILEGKTKLEKEHQGLTIWYRKAPAGEMLSGRDIENYKSFFFPCLYHDSQDRALRFPSFQADKGGVRTTEVIRLIYRLKPFPSHGCLTRGFSALETTIPTTP